MGRVAGHEFLSDAILQVKPFKSVDMIRGHYTHDVRRRERYHCILLLMDGKSCPEIAQWLYRDEETVRSWVHAFNEPGLRGLERAPVPRRPT